MGRFVVVVLDSFGVGAMDDVPAVRPADIGSNTCKHILERCPKERLPHLERLGLINALGEEVGAMGFAHHATYGTSDLLHEGADSFLGHQEIMGSRPMKPLIEPFAAVIEQVEAHLRLNGYEVQRIGDPVSVLLVNQCAVIGDNLETDSGQVYNVTGLLGSMTFAEIEALGRCVREVVFVSRVIALGGERVSVDELLAARRIKSQIYTGIDTPLSGVYREGYRVTHLGYGINKETQVPTILGNAGIPVSLIGKVENIVANERGSNHPGVDTKELMACALQEIGRLAHGFICVNVQETDLAGHAQDVRRYMDRLQLSDYYIGLMLEQLDEADILIVTADHGNDPTIGHSQHTREKVPILVYAPMARPGHIGHYPTLACIGATAADYFQVSLPEHGTSFLPRISGA